MRKALPAALLVVIGAVLSARGAGLAPAAAPARRTVDTFHYDGARGAVRVTFRSAAPELAGIRAEVRVSKFKKDYLVKAVFRKLPPPSSFGPGYLTYVVWAITADGRVGNIGEVTLSGRKGSMEVLAGFADFGVVVTAEPYFAVPQPSDRVLLESDAARDSSGPREGAAATYTVASKDRAIALGSDRAPLADARAPLALLEARNAVRIARKAGAERYASSTFSQATQLLESAEALLARHASRNRIVDQASHAVIVAEDARAIAAQQGQP